MKKVKLEGEVKTTILNVFNLRYKGLKKHSVSSFFFFFVKVKNGHFASRVL